MFQQSCGGDHKEREEEDPGVGRGRVECKFSKKADANGIQSTEWVRLIQDKGHLSKS